MDQTNLGPPRMWKIPYATIPLLVLGLHDLFRANSLWAEPLEKAEANGSAGFVFYDQWPWFYLISGLIILISMLVNFKDGRAQLIAMFTIVIINVLRFTDILNLFGWDSRHFGTPFLMTAMFAAWALVWLPPQRLDWHRPPWAQSRPKEAEDVE